MSTRAGTFFCVSNKGRKQDYIAYINSRTGDIVDVSESMVIYRSFSRESGIIKQGGKYGIVNTKFEVLLEPEYDGITRIEVGFRFQIENNEGSKYGIMDKNGRVIVEPFFEDINDFSEGMAAVKFEGKWGYINESFSVVIEPRYDYAWEFSDGIATVRVDGLDGLINKDGSQLTEIKYMYCKRFHDGYAIGYRDYFHVLIDSSGKEVFRTYMNIRYTYNGFVKVDENGNVGFIDEDDNMVIMPEFEDAHDFSEGMAAVFRLNPDDKEATFYKKTKELRGGFINTKGELVVDIKFFDVADFSEGLAAVKTGGYKDGKWGYIDKTGRIVIEARFDEAGEFKNGLAVVKLNGIVTLINRTGKIIYPLDQRRIKSIRAWDSSE